MPVRWDAATGLENIDVDLHLIRLVEKCLVGQDVLGVIREGRDVEDHRGLKFWHGALLGPPLLGPNVAIPA